MNEVTVRLVIYETRDVWKAVSE